MYVSLKPFLAYRYWLQFIPQPTSKKIRQRRMFLPKTNVHLVFRASPRNLFFNTQANMLNILTRSFKSTWTIKKTRAVLCVNWIYKITLTTLFLLKRAVFTLSLKTPNKLLFVILRLLLFKLITRQRQIKIPQTNIYWPQQLTFLRPAKMAKRKRPLQRKLHP